jgi:uncharacterized membrane protein
MLIAQAMSQRQKILAVLGIPALWALFITQLPDTTWESVAITQGPIIILAAFAIYTIIGQSFSETANKLAVAGAALIGLTCAAYLAIKWGQNSAPQCSTGGCVKAQYSSYADFFFGIRTTTVGIIGYLLTLLSLLIPGNYGRLATLVLGALGFAVSVFLTSASVFILNTTCQWCLGSAAAMTAIIVLSYWRFWKTFSIFPAK